MSVLIIGITIATTLIFLHQSGLKRFGTSHMPPIVARGVILDWVVHQKSVDASQVITASGVGMLRADVAINEAEICGALARQNLKLASAHQGHGTDDH